MNNSSCFIGSCASLRRAVVLMVMCIAAIGAQAQSVHNHQRGFTNRDYVEHNGHLYQSVHEDHYVMYATAGSTVRMDRPSGAFASYFRWYDYDTDFFLNNLNVPNAGKRKYGYYRAYYDASGAGMGTATYDYSGSGVVRVACDESTYHDWVGNVNNAPIDGQPFTEPTLSNRLIFEIRPASEMAARVDAAVGDNWLEEYDITAPVGNEVFVGPEFCYFDDDIAALGGAVRKTWGNYFCTVGGTVVPMGTTTITSTLDGAASSAYRPTRGTGDGMGNKVYVRTVVNGWRWQKKAATDTDWTDCTSDELSNGQYLRTSASVEGDVEYRLTYTVGAQNTSVTTWKADPNYYFWKRMSVVTTYDNSATGQTYNIAHFTVHYKSTDEVGPKRNLNASVLNGTILLAKEDFNFGATSLPTTTTYYDKPFAWDESTFGFYYPDKKDMRPRTSNSATGAPSSARQLPYFNEYAFVNNGTGSSQNTHMKNHDDYNPDGDATKGYAVYVDGAQKQGTVFALNFNADLCNGATMYFSAYVGCAQEYALDVQIDVRPVLDLQFVGVKADGSETVIATYTTGGLTDNHWNRVLFPIEFHGNVTGFDNYRLKVTNKAATTSGNDFWIDDIAIYLQKAAIDLMQESNSSDCFDADAETNMSMLYARVDYQQLGATADHLYYRWFKEETDGTLTPQTTAYAVSDASKTSGATEGYIDLSATPAASTVCADFASFDALRSRAAAAAAPVYKFIRESGLQPITVGGTQNTERYVLYVATPINANPGEYYTFVIGSDKENLSDADKCANAASFQVAEGLRLEGDKIGTLKVEPEYVCANYTDELKMTVEYVIFDEATNTTVTKKADYTAHWLYGDEEYVTANPSLYNGYSYAEIVAAINTDDRTVLDYLIRHDLFTEASGAQGTLIVQPLGQLTGEQQLTYTGFPVAPIDADDAPQCLRTKGTSFKVQTMTDANAIYFVKGADEAETPDYVVSRPRRVRILEGTTYADVALKLTNLEYEYTPEEALLYATDDADMQSQIGTFSIGKMFEKPAAETDELTEANPITKNTGEVRFTNLASLKGGKSYTFRIAYLANNAERDLCYTGKGELFIEFVVAPKVVTFGGSKVDPANPDQPTESWNADDSWTSPDGTPGVVPMPGTSVILTPGATIFPTPTVTPSSDQYPYADPTPDPDGHSHGVDEGAEPYISYDINYTPYECDNLYIPTGTPIVGQTNLKVNGDWVFDVPVTPGKWQMTAMPVRGVVSGDMFSPAAGESKENPFEVKKIMQPENGDATIGGTATDRITYRFYNSLYNQPVYQETTCDYAVDITSSTWSYATNALNTPFGPGYGWALGFSNASGAEAAEFIRLPKKDNIYNYFYQSVWHSHAPEVVERDPNYGKPIFEGDMDITVSINQSGKVFLFGNPTFACIDLTKFIRENEDAIENTVYLSCVPSNRYEHATLKNLTEDWVSSLSKDVTKPYLAPMEAMLVIAKSEGKELKLKVTEEMLCAGDIEASDAHNAPRRSAARQASERMIQINAVAGRYTSGTLLMQEENADNGFLPEEDAEVFLLDDTKTPFAIYTVESHKALAINRFASSRVIPLAFYSQREVSEVALTFSGEDSYLAEWDLVDNESGSRTALSDGFATVLEMDNSGAVRYSLEHSREYISGQATDLEQLNARFSTFAQDGQLTVWADTDMQAFALYNAAGQLIFRTADAGRFQQFDLPAGAYVVRANGESAKVIIK